MRRPTLFLALLTGLPLAAAIGGTGFPADEVVVRNNCYAQSEDELGAVLGGQASGGVALASPTVQRGGGGSTRAKPAKTPAAGPPPPPSAADGAAPSGRAARNQSAEAEMLDDLGYAPAPPMEAKEEAQKPTRTAEPDRDTREKPPADTVARRVMDWGATIFLSNDDSMSISSAQRVIWALQNGAPLPLDNIRPHELLNYFSFDVADPTTEQLFDVHMSAARDGEQLSVALAVQGATPEREPLDLTLVVDRSCSMEEEGRMDYTRRGLQKMAEQLKRGDRIDLVLFDDAICTPLENFVVGRDDPKLLTNAIDRMRPNGATDVDLGLKEGYRIASGHVDTHHRNRRVMIVTDAEMNTGDVNPNTVTEIGKHFDQSGIRLTGVGVGRTFRDDVLDKLTEKGKGAYVFLGSEAVVDRVFGTNFESLVQTIAHDVQFSLDLPDSLAMERFYGEEASTNAADIQPIHYYAGTSQVFLQDLAIRDAKVVRNDPVTLTINYRDAQTGEPEKRVFKTTIGEMLETDRHNVDKARALMAWTDLLQERAFGGDPCGATLDTYASRAARLGDDAEIAFVNGLVTGICGQFDLPAAVAAAPLKVRVDSDQDITHVALSCPGVDARSSLSGSDTVATFEAVAGMCTLTLGGVVDMAVEVEVPETGRDLRCTVRGGRVHCG